MPRQAHVVLPLPEKIWLTPAEAGALISISERQIRRLVDAGELRGVRVRSSVRIPRAELARFVAAQEGAA